MKDIKELVKFLKKGKYNIEDLDFLNMRTHSKYNPSGYGRNDFCIFDIEDMVTVKGKIKIIDMFNDNIATYMLDLIAKWNKDKESLPKDYYGYTKLNSYKAWINRNDSRKIISTVYLDRSSLYYLFGTHFKCLTDICPSTEYGYALPYTDEHIVHQWFHDFCLQLKKGEDEWFQKNDPIQIKIDKVRELGRNFSTIFNCKLLNNIVNNHERNATNEQLDTFIEAYESMEKCIQEQIEKISKTLGSDVMFKEEDF